MRLGLAKKCIRVDGLLLFARELFGSFLLEITEKLIGEFTSVSAASRLVSIECTYEARKNI